MTLHLQSKRPGFQELKKCAIRSTLQSVLWLVTRRKLKGIVGRRGNRWKDFYTTIPLEKYTWISRITSNLDQQLQFYIGQSGNNELDALPRERGGFHAMTTLPSSSPSTWYRGRDIIVIRFVDRKVHSETSIKSRNNEYGKSHVRRKRRMSIYDRPYLRNK